MTNETIIYNAACELMKQGIIKATGRSADDRRWREFRRC